MQHHPAAGGEHRAEHVDQADEGLADADDAAADLRQHARDRDLRPLDDRAGFHAAHLVDQARIIGGETRDLGLDIALGQAAAQPLDQPGAERIELRDLRDVDEDVGAAAGELLGIAHDGLEQRRKRRGPGTAGAQRKAIAARNTLQGRIAVHRRKAPAPDPRQVECPH